MKTAGQSAQAEYERRSERDRDRRRRMRPAVIALALIFPIVGYVATQLFVDRIGETLSDQLATVGAEREDPRILDETMTHQVGLLVGAFLGIGVLGAALSRRQSTEAWRVGAAGERRTGKALDKLPDGFRVVHDLPLPSSKANIDHVVIGPTGVFTVETKNYANGITIQRRRATSSGRSMDKVVQQAKRQAEALRSVVGESVTPIVCVHGGGVIVKGFFQKPVVDGVHFCGGKRLRTVITNRESVLEDADVERIAALTSELEGVR